LRRHGAFHLETDTLSIAVVLPRQQERTRPSGTRTRLHPTGFANAACTRVDVRLREDGEQQYVLCRKQYVGTLYSWQ